MSTIIKLPKGPVDDARGVDEVLGAGQMSIIIKLPKGPVEDAQSVDEVLGAGLHAVTCSATVKAMSAVST